MCTNGVGAAPQATATRQGSFQQALQSAWHHFFVVVSEDRAEVSLSVARSAGMASYIVILGANKTRRC